MTGGPITWSGAMTTSTCSPAGSGGCGIWSTIASTDTLPGGPSSVGVAAAGAVVERDHAVRRCVDREVPVDRWVDTAEAADAHAVGLVAQVVAEQDGQSIERLPAPGRP